MKLYKNVCSALFIMLGIIAAPLLVLAESVIQSPVPSPLAQTSQDLMTSINNQVDSRIAISSPTTGLSLYNTRDATTATRNVSAWVSLRSPLDFTGVAAWNSGTGVISGTWGGATLITPRHYIDAWHFNIGVGEKMTFFDRNGNAVIRTVVSSTNIPGTDIGVGMLDSDVDSSIAHYTLMSPSSFRNAIIQTTGQAIDIPLVVFDQFGEALLREMSSFDADNIQHAKYTTGDRAPFSKDLIKGDSGQPIFVVINNTPVLLSSNFQAVSGPNAGAFFNEINAAIDTLGNHGYHASLYPLTSFTVYTLVTNPPVVVVPPSPTPQLTPAPPPPVVLPPAKNGIQNSSSNSSGGSSGGGGGSGSYYSGGSGGSTYYSVSANPVNSTVPTVATQNTNANTNASSGANSPTFSGKISRRLALKDEGEDVRMLQIMLNSLGYRVNGTGAGSPGQETSYFGPLTAGALAKFQSDHADSGVRVTGSLDNATLLLLSNAYSKLPKPTSAAGNYSNTTPNKSGTNYSVSNVTKPASDGKIVTPSNNSDAVVPITVTFTAKIQQVFTNVLHFFKFF